MGLSVAVSQEKRLVEHAALREQPGYDLTDPWLVGNGAVTAALIPGMPCQLVGGGGVIVAFLGHEKNGASQASGVSCRIRFPDGNVGTRLREHLLPLPTRAARQGDWALPIGLRDDEERFLGRRGHCGLAGVILGPPRQQGFWMSFEPSDPTFPPEVTLIGAGNLVALPEPPVGAAQTPWEARCSINDSTPSSSLPALIDEAAMEQQVALRYGNVGDGGEDGETSSETSESGNTEPGEGSHTVLLAGALVRVASINDRPGRIELVNEASGEAVIQLLDTPGEKGVVYCALSALAQLSSSKLTLDAVCRGCNKAEPEDKLLMCERFSIACLGCWHLGCLKPPLKVVPKGEWFCEQCRNNGGTITSTSAEPAQPQRKRIRGVTKGKDC